MAHAASDNLGDGDGNKPLSSFGGTIFLQQGAHVTVLDDRGLIITVNDAWHRFGRDNGLNPAYRFAGVSYLDVCERAIAAKHGNEGASDALGGINRILAAEEKRFSLVYPCHAPDKQRWFLMYARPIGPGTDGAVVSHVDVTSLHLAGFVPDETESPPGAPADAPSDAPSSRDGADKLAQLLFADRPNPLAANPLRLR